MYKYSLYIVTLSFLVACSAQKKSIKTDSSANVKIPNDVKIYESDQVDVKPKLDNEKSKDAILKFSYPEDARRNHVAGNVMLECIITAGGKATDCEVTKKLYPSLDKAALKMAWQSVFDPGKKDGQPVYTRFQFPISFGLQGFKGKN